MPIDNDCPKDVERLVEGGVPILNGGKVVTPTEAAFRQATQAGFDAMVKSAKEAVERLPPPVEQVRDRCQYCGHVPGANYCDPANLTNRAGRGAQPKRDLAPSGSHELCGFAECTPGHLDHKRDRWKDNQDIERLVGAAEEAVKVLSTYRTGHGGGRICECQCRECFEDTRAATARLSKAVKDME